MHKVVPLTLLVTAALFAQASDANLVGGDGFHLAEIFRQVNHPALVLVFDAANLIVQGFSPSEILEQFRAMAPGLGWLHVKDYRNPRPVAKGGHVDEDALHHFVPADEGDAAHEAIFREFRGLLPELESKLHRRGIPGVFVDLEPHLKGGGQFGGFSGPDGMGVALRALRPELPDVVPAGLRRELGPDPERVDDLQVVQGVLDGALHVAREGGEALRVIGVEERVTGGPAEDVGELPAQVLGVVDRAVQAEAAGGRVAVRGVADQEDAPDPGPRRDEPLELLEVEHLEAGSLPQQLQPSQVIDRGASQTQRRRVHAAERYPEVADP